MEISDTMLAIIFFISSLLIPPSGILVQVLFDYSPISMGILLSAL